MPLTIVRKCVVKKSTRSWTFTFSWRPEMRMLLALGLLAWLFGVAAGQAEGEGEAIGIKYTYKEMDDAFEFEVEGSSEGYIAIGFNSELKMIDASIVECIKDGSLHLTHASTKSMPPTRLDSPELLGLEKLEVKHENGVITCKFKRKKKLDSGSTTFHDLKDADCIILARGNLDGDNIAYHQVNRATVTCDGLSGGVATSAGLPLLIRLHGSLMLIAWIGCISLGITIARYYKDTFAKDCQCLGKACWFRMHQTYQTIGVLAAVTAVILIFVHVGGWIGEDSFTHAICGIVACGLGVMQPIMALFRCHPGTENRYIFNWAHRIVGGAAHILAIATIVLAVMLPAAEITDNKNAFIAVAIFFVVIHTCNAVSQEIIVRAYGSQSKVAPRQAEDNDAAEDDGRKEKSTSQRAADTKNAPADKHFEFSIQESQEGASGVQESKNKYHKILLLAYGILVWSAAATLVFLVNL